MQIDLRLIVNPELLLLYRAVKQVAQPRIFHRLVLMNLLAQGVLILAVRLGLVHGNVGVFHQCFGVCSIVRVQRHADAGGHVEFLPAQNDRLLNSLQNPADHLNQLFLVRHPTEHQHKFVPADPRHHVARPDTGGDRPCNLPQEQIARIVPQRIVERFKGVQIDKGHRDFDIFSLGTF